MSEQLVTVGNLVDQIRTLLQDTDNSSGSYRYTTSSIVTNLNQGLGDLYRIRPDLFLAVNFVLPQYTVAGLNVAVAVEPQYISPLIFYIVGLTQARDDEQTQDARAGVFLDTFTKQVLQGIVA